MKFFLNFSPWNRFCAGILFCLFSVMIQAQSVKLEWAKSNGGSRYDYCRDHHTDYKGNIYLTGVFMDTVDFDPGAARHDIISNGNNDIFIQKLDASGNFIWAYSIGGIYDDQGYSITTDELGNVLVTGYYEGNIDFDPGPSTYYLDSKWHPDLFILKLDANGNFQWAKTIGASLLGIGGGANGESIVTDKYGNVLVIGVFTDTADFDPGVGIHRLSSNGSSDIFALKLDKNGIFKWAKTIGGSTTDYGEGIVLDFFGNVILTGVFQLTVDFDPGPNVHNLTSLSTYDVFILKLDSNGNFVWAKSLEGDFSYESVNSICSDSKENIYICGKFFTSADFDPSSLVYNMTSNGINASDAFLLKIDKNGDFLWAKSIGSLNNDSGDDVVSDLYDNIYWTGFYQLTVDFDPGISILNITSQGVSDVFVQKLDPYGNLIWVKSFGGEDTEQGWSISRDSVNNIFISGFFNGTAIFDGIALKSKWTDYFTLKLNQTPVGLEEKQYFDGITVYPNPTTGWITVNLNTISNASICILNSKGQVVSKEEILGPLYQCELNGPTGLYIIEINASEGKQRKKLVKM